MWITREKNGYGVAMASTNPLRPTANVRRKNTPRRSQAHRRRYRTDFLAVADRPSRPFQLRKF